MQRYFVEKMNVEKKTAAISGADFEHIKNVFKSKPGDSLIVCHEGNCFKAIIKSFKEDEVLCSLENKLESPTRDYQITIAQGIIKHGRFEYMLQKSAELGADYIIPIMSQYSIVKLNSQEASTDIERWNKITKDASEQAHRKTKCMVLPIEELHALKFKSYDIVLVAYEKENMSHSLKYILQKKFKNLLIVIGPEGGLSDEEIQFLSGYGNVEFIGLGHRILRSETASSYILSVLNYEYEMIL